MAKKSKVLLLQTIFINNMYKQFLAFSKENFCFKQKTIFLRFEV